MEVKFCHGTGDIRHTNHLHYESLERQIGAVAS
jgi:hypothetical protein